MRDKLCEVMKKHGVGIPAVAISAYELCDALEAHLAAQDDRLNELLGYLGEIRDHVLGAIERLDVNEYDELLGPCVGSPAEVVRAAGVLKELVIGGGIDCHIALVDDGKMWSIFLDGQVMYILPPGCIPALGQCLKCLLLGGPGRAAIEAPSFMVPDLISREPLGVWAEVAQIIDEGEHQLVVSYEFVVG